MVFFMEYFECIFLLFFVVAEYNRMFYIWKFGFVSLKKQYKTSSYSKTLFDQ